jgi:hypothetical protein
MARARNIKPGFFQNEELAELEPIDRLAFIALWTVCDYKGCLEYRPKRLKIQLLPYDDIDIEKTVVRLEKAGFVQVYKIENESFIKIINFEKHQNPHKNEREAGSDIPDIDGTKSDIIGTTRADSLLLIPDSLLLIPEDGFNEFWNIFPRKTKKEDARKAWKQNKPNIDLVLKALDWQMRSKDWVKDDGKWIPYPATWIRAHQWEDEQPIEGSPF